MSNSRLDLDSMLAREAAASDLELAGRIEQLLFPKSSPTCDWCCIGVKNRMARGLGGDYFDFITMPDKCQTILIGDVTGHGLHASVVMALIYGFIHRAAKDLCHPLELVSQVNDFLVYFADRSEHLDYYFSSTMFFGIITPDTLEMRYVNAGHTPPMILRHGTVVNLDTTGQPIGFFKKPELEMQTFSFQKGDRFLLCTDGITEAENSSKDQFGRERLEQILRSSGQDYMEFLDHLFAELGRFGACDPPVDDCTAIVLDFHGFR